MTTKTIVLLGATGRIGSALALNLAGGPYRLLLFGRDDEKTKELAASIQSARPGADVSASACPVDASWEADIIIPALPYGAEKEAAARFRDVATQKIVISLSNPLNAQFNGLLTAPGTSAAEELQAALPHAKVVKAFNTIFNNMYGQPLPNGDKLDSFIAGNDAEAVQTVAALAADAGLNPVIAGDLTVSRTLENMTLLLLQLSSRNGWNREAGWKVVINHQNQ